MRRSRKPTGAIRLAALVLVKHAGASIDDAAATLGVDKRTVGRWVDSATIPDESWAALEKMLLAMAADRSARGELRNLAQLMTAAGIASRNVRYATLIARREARRAQAQAEAEAAARPNPVYALDHDRRKWLVSYLDMAIEYHRIIEANGGPKVADIPNQPVEYDEAEYVRQIEAVSAASDAELRAMRDALAADAARHLTGWRAFRDRPDGDLLILDRNGQRFVWMRHPELYASLPVIVQHGDGLNVTPEQRSLIAEAEQLLLETAP